MNMRNQNAKWQTLISLLVVSAFIVISGSGAKVVAQQMSDMPYDLHFIDMMIMHHQEGIEMAELAQTKAQSAKVKAFATKTAADQKKDIDELQSHRKHWYADKPIMDHSTMQSMMQKMHPDMKMDMEDTRRRLRATNGAAFDRLFLDTMIHHHMMGVDMAKEATTKVEHNEIKEFAQKTVTKQTAEITEMNGLKGAPKTATKARAKAKPRPKTTSTHKH
jgi:uncharacterized protein (DUF305 family)